MMIDSLGDESETRSFVNGIVDLSDTLDPLHPVLSTLREIATVDAQNHLARRLFFRKEDIAESYTVGQMLDGVEHIEALIIHWMFDSLDESTTKLAPPVVELALVAVPTGDASIATSSEVVFPVNQDVLRKELRRDHRDSFLLQRGRVAPPSF